MSAYYCGCISEVGHYWWTPPGVKIRDIFPPKDQPWGAVDGKLQPKRTRAQSAAAVHHMDGWTALAVWDSSVDRRPGSTSTFLFDADLSDEDAAHRAAALFPEVVQRIVQAAPIRIVESDGVAAARAFPQPQEAGE